MKPAAIWIAVARWQKAAVAAAWAAVRSWTEQSSLAAEAASWAEPAWEWPRERRVPKELRALRLDWILDSSPDSSREPRRVQAVRRERRDAEA